MAKACTPHRSWWYDSHVSNVVGCLVMHTMPIRDVTRALCGATVAAAAAIKPPDGADDAVKSMRRDIKRRTQIIVESSIYRNSYQV